MMLPVLQVANSVAVGLFGMVLSCAFCPVKWERRNVLIMAACAFGIFLVQGLLLFLCAGGSQPSGLSAQHASAAGPGALRAQPEKALAVYFGADGLSLLPDAPLDRTGGGRRVFRRRNASV